MGIIGAGWMAAQHMATLERLDGVVVVAGEVPTAYERQLVSHFCRQIPGVVKFVDAMVLRSAPAPAAPKRPARASRGPRTPGTWPTGERSLRTAH